jgi:Ca2+-binding EF-hand superfamily protein
MADQLTDSEINLTRDAFTLQDTTRKGKIPVSAIPHVLRSVGFNATLVEIAVHCCTLPFDFDPSHLAYS